MDLMRGWLLVLLVGLSLLVMTNAGAKMLLPETDPVVATPVGTFIGTTARGGLKSFLGIRYGTPPIGAQRFRPATLYAPPDPQQVFPAQEYGPECWQPTGNPAQMSEDCLYLNIFVPGNASSTALPVVLWIHGGGFLVGSGSSYKAQVLAEQAALVVVSINYRLGPLGLLSSPILYQESGTFGGINAVGDQMVALAWVAKYIGYFGGDATRLTVMGESAGGVSAGIIAISPALTTPIERATVQSGPLFGLTPLSLTQGVDFVAAACQLAGYGACNMTLLRSAAPQALLHDLLQAGLQVLSRPPSKVGAWPWSVDGWILPELPRDMLAQLGKKYALHPRTLITGFVSMDGIISPPLNTGVPPLPNNATAYQAYLQAYFGANQTQVALLNTTYYPLAEFQGRADQAWTQMNADACWVCPTLGLNRAIQAAVPTATLYTFEFLGAMPPAYRSAHGGDVYFLFDMEFWAVYFHAGWSAELSHSMQRGWSSFAITGVPDLETGPTWTPFTSEDPVMLLQAGPGRSLQVAANFFATHHANACEGFWLDQQQVTPAMLLQMCWEYPAPAWPNAQSLGH